MLTVNDLMTVDPVTVAPDTSLGRIVALMKKEGCRQLPVVDNDKLVGIVTDRDVRLILNSPLALQEHSEDKAFVQTIVAEGLMTMNPITVTPDTPAYKAAEMLSIYKFGALPVVEGSMLVGIISVTDFLDLVSTSRSEASFLDFVPATRSEATFCHP
ncbi:MAG: CBS domain-containing protein [Candidatus Promineifilaceae bacterium]